MTPTEAPPPRGARDRSRSPSPIDRKSIGRVRAPAHYTDRQHVDNSAPPAARTTETKFTGYSHLKWKADKRTDDNGAKRRLPVHHQPHPANGNLGGTLTRNEIADNFGVPRPDRGGHHKQVFATSTIAPPGFKGHYVAIDSPWADGSPVVRPRNGRLPWQNKCTKRALSGWLSSITRWAVGMADPHTGVIHLNILYTQFNIQKKFLMVDNANDMDDFI